MENKKNCDYRPMALTLVCLVFFVEDFVLVSGFRAS